VLELSFKKEALVSTNPSEIIYCSNTTQITTDSCIVTSSIGNFKNLTFYIGSIASLVYKIPSFLVNYSICPIIYSIKMSDGTSLSSSILFVDMSTLVLTAYTSDPANVATLNLNLTATSVSSMASATIQVNLIYACGTLPTISPQTYTLGSNDLIISIPNFDSTCGFFTGEVLLFNN
jgi:hypothetical protein